MGRHNISETTTAFAVCTSSNISMHRAPTSTTPQAGILAVIGVAVAAALVLQHGAQAAHNQPPDSTIVTLPISDTEQAQQPATTVPPTIDWPVIVHILRMEIVISYAQTHIGDPYVWAAVGPHSFDCSGLVLSAFANIGIELPHYTGAMIGYGKSVEAVDLRRGDIVYPQRHHVGIYLGNGLMIHASSSRHQIVIGKVYAFYAARRIQ